MARGVDFITRADCPLCDRARAIIDRIAPRIGLEVGEIDVDTDPLLLESYGERVPVARSASGAVLAEGKWSSARVWRRLVVYRLSGR